MRKILYVEDLVPQPPTFRRSGRKPIGQFWGYKVIGRFDKPEDFYYKDADGNIKPVALLKGEKPNLFDAAFLRKWAYKGVCDALAGEDLGLKFGGEQYKAYYERQNVSDTVK